MILAIGTALRKRSGRALLWAAFVIGAITFGLSFAWSPEAGQEPAAVTGFRQHRAQALRTVSGAAVLLGGMFLAASWRRQRASARRTA